MTPITPVDVGAKVILRGIHLELTDAMRSLIQDKAGKLLRHEPRIDRIRIDIELDKTHAGQDHFVAKGHIEIGGPDMLASATSEDAYKSIDELISKLDRMLRKRATAFESRRHGETLRDAP